MKLHFAILTASLLMSGPTWSVECSNSNGWPYASVITDPLTQIDTSAAFTYTLVTGDINNPTFTMEPGARICGPLKFYDKKANVIFELKADACYPDKETK